MKNLLWEVLAGIVVSLFFLLRSSFRSSVFVVNDADNYLLRLRKDVSFLNKLMIKTKLEEIPEDASILIDATRADFIDKDVIEEINKFMIHAYLKNIRVNIKRSQHNPLHSMLQQPVVNETEAEIVLV